MFSKRVVCFLTLFTAFGLHLELPHMNIQRKISHIVFVIYIGVSIFLTFYLTKVGLWLLWNRRITQMVNGIFEYLSALGTNWVFIIESYVQRRHQYQFWQLLEDIDHRFARRDTSVSKAYLIKFFENYAAYAVVVTVEYLNVPELKSNDIFIVFRTLGLYAINRMFYYLFYMELIVFELKIIDNEVKQMVAAYSRENFLMARRNTFLFQQNRFLWLREYYQQVHRLNECINLTFGLSIGVSITHIFMSLLCQLNWSHRANIPNISVAIGIYQLLQPYQRFIDLSI